MEIHDRSWKIGRKTTMTSADRPEGVRAIDGSNKQACKNAAESLLSGIVSEEHTKNKAP